MEANAFRDQAFPARAGQKHRARVGTNEDRANTTAMGPATREDREEVLVCLPQHSEADRQCCVGLPGRFGPKPCFGRRMPQWPGVATAPTRAARSTSTASGRTACIAPCRVCGAESGSKLRRSRRAGGGAVVVALRRGWRGWWGGLKASERNARTPRLCPRPFPFAGALRRVESEIQNWIRIEKLFAKESVPLRTLPGRTSSCT